MNVTERVLLAMRWELGPVFPKTLQRDLSLSRSSVRRGLFALLMLGFVERGALHRSGRLWSLTPAGRRAANVLDKAPVDIRAANSQPKEPT